MRILAIVHQYPMFDRASGGLRLFEILRLLAKQHQVTISGYQIGAQTRHFGQAEMRRYRDAMVDAGIAVPDAEPLRVMRSAQFDVLLFEFYFVAARYLDEARLLQPRAAKIVDSVDVHFNRLFARARLTGSAEHLEEAERVKRLELEAYRQADHVIAVTDEDRRILLAEEPVLSVGVVPNIHVMRPLDGAGERESGSLLFVGNFRHDPNIDAMLWFCGEILPRIRHEVPGVRLRIAGDAPPDTVRELARDDVEVLGYVPDLARYLNASRVSVAPLRYGGGMKGKIGEAMAAGLPVVSTSTGVEGFGITPGRDALVADDPLVFCSAVVRLLKDNEFYEATRRAGWRFIADRFSVEAVEANVLSLMGKVAAMPVRQPSSKERLKAVIPAALRHFLARRR